MILHLLWTLSRCNEEEGASEALEAAKRKIEDECDKLKGDIENLELNLQKVGLCGLCIHETRERDGS